MNKRIFSLFLAICMILSLMTGPEITASTAASGKCGENLTWLLNDSGTLTISGSGEMENWFSLSDVPWYSQRQNISSVTIESGVTSIGIFAFYGCSKLISAKIGNSVTSIKTGAFWGCSSLISVTIGNSVTSISEYAFNGCSSLTSIVIPDSVTNIDTYAFSECNSLTSITVDSGNKNYSSFEGNLFDKNKTTLIRYAIGKQDTHYTIPNSVTNIGDSAFYNCSRLTSVTIPDGVTSIGSAAFKSCVQLTRVAIPDSVTSIGDHAFNGCNSLISVTIRDSVTSIGAYAFRGCGSLTSVTIGNSVISIGNYAFYLCSSLTDVYYTGSEEQWERVSFGSNNECLTKASIHYNYSPVTDNSNTISVNKETKSITFSSTEEIQQAALSVVLFKDGKLIEMKLQSIKIEKGINTFESPITDYLDSDTVKIMIWDSITGMKPLFNCCSVNW